MSAAANHCSCSDNIYPQQGHVQVINDVNSRCLGSLGQFCEAFYHTPAKLYTNVQQWENCGMICLDPEVCTVGRKKDTAQPKSAVALVTFKDRKADILLKKRYTNCHRDREPMHAEDFFKDDMEMLAGTQALRDVCKITMYITMQPCHLSVQPDTEGSRENHDCCNTIIEVAKQNTNIEIWIKPAHLSQAGWTKKDDGWDELIENAERGLKMLMATRNITVSRMTEFDWEYLWSEVDVDELLEIPTWRRYLDDDIGEKLSKWSQEVMYSRLEANNRLEEMIREKAEMHQLPVSLMEEMIDEMRTIME